MCGKHYQEDILACGSQFSLLLRTGQSRTDRGREKKGHSFFFLQSLFFFQITVQVKRMLDYLNLVGCGPWARFGWGSTGEMTTAFCSACEEPLLSPQRVLDSYSFRRRKKEARTVALCVSQRQHCFLGLALPTDNVLPFMRDCFTAPTHGLPGASLHTGEKCWMPPATPAQLTKQRMDITF